MSGAEALQEIQRLAGHDGLLQARSLLDAYFPNGDGTDYAPTVQELRAELHRLTAHADSNEAYRDFYANAPPDRRPFMLPEQIPKAHNLHIRWFLVRQALEWTRADNPYVRPVRDVLELGCFDAWTLLNLCWEAQFTGTGVDVAPHAVNEANRRAAKFSLPVRVYESFLEDAQLGPNFDAVLLLEVLEHVRDPELALAACDRHLRPGGRVYLSVPLTPPRHTGEQERREHLRLIDRDALWALMGEKRKIVWYHQFPSGLGVEANWGHVLAYELR